jgi:hypothetical protein
MPCWGICDNVLAKKYLMEYIMNSFDDNESAFL